MIALLLSFAFMMKPLYVIPSGMLGLLLLLAPEISVRQKLIFIGSCAACALLFALSSLWIYGGILAPYFAPSRVESFNLARLLGVLFSPGRGLLWFTPSALVVLIVPFLVWHDRRSLIVCGLAAAAIVSAILAVSNFEYWWGGWSYGPRLFQFALPAVAILSLTLVQVIAIQGRQVRIIALTALVSLSGWESFVHVSGAVSDKATAWNATPVNVNNALYRLWDWTDPQFLAAFRGVNS